jgi:hypothetical protein
LRKLNLNLRTKNNCIRRKPGFGGGCKRTYEAFCCV